MGRRGKKHQPNVYVWCAVQPVQYIYQQTAHNMFR